jgi:hypothetical protein
MLNEPDQLTVYINILNKTWSVVGLPAIADLVRWLDENASADHHNQREKIPLAHPSNGVSR